LAKSFLSDFTESNHFTDCTKPIQVREIPQKMRKSGFFQFSTVLVSRNNPVTLLTTVAVHFMNDFDLSWQKFPGAIRDVVTLAATTTACGVDYLRKGHSEKDRENDRHHSVGQIGSP
jgi:hypothetical protein